MAEVFGEWRRTGSPCGGGLVLWWRDLRPGAGWGLLDSSARPKLAYHHLRRTLAPVAVWSTDEGLSGIAVHLANDTPRAISARLRVALYRDLEVPVGDVTLPVELPPHSTHAHDVEALLGRFVDASWAYRFGPPAQDLVACTLEHDGHSGVEILSQSFRLPAGRPLHREPASRLGLQLTLTEGRDDGELRLTLRTQRFAFGVRVEMPGFRASDDGFSVEPAGSRCIVLTRTEPATEIAGVAVVSALNLSGRLRVKRAGAA
jgi:beta-mannosidase